MLAAALGRVAGVVPGRVTGARVAGARVAVAAVLVAAAGVVRAAVGLTVPVVGVLRPTGLVAAVVGGAVAVVLRTVGALAADTELPVRACAAALDAVAVEGTVRVVAAGRVAGVAPFVLAVVGALEVLAASDCRAVVVTGRLAAAAVLAAVADPGVGLVAPGTVLVVVFAASKQARKPRCIKSKEQHKTNSERLRLVQVSFLLLRLWSALDGLPPCLLHPGFLSQTLAHPAPVH